MKVSNANTCLYSHAVRSYLHSHPHGKKKKKAVAQSMRTSTSTLELTDGSMNKAAYCGIFPYRDSNVVGLCEECFWISLRLNDHESFH